MRYIFWKAGGSMISIMIIISSYHHIIVSSYQFDGAYRCPMDAIFHLEKNWNDLYKKFSFKKLFIKKD